MRKVMLAVAAISLFAAYVHATTVNPTSNVLADTAATADTLVLRDSSGNMAIAATDISASAIVTSKLSSSAVTTSKLYLDLKPSSVACVTTGRLLGVCSNAPASGLCNCN